MTSFLRYTLVFLMVCSRLFVGGQELNCKVEINTDKITGTNKQVFQTLEEAINEYVNSTVFTPHHFSANEKIECRMFFTIGEITSEGKIRGDLQVQALRPVYNSSYTTTLLNFKDSKIEFDYQEGDQLVFSANTMESQLTAILNYYVYLILAIDYDSFQLNGGEPFYDRLKMIVQMAQSSGESGWKAFEDTKNRSAVLSSLTDGNTGAAMREMIYNYHLRGLDQMAVSPDKGRQNITKSLTAIGTLYNQNPMSVGLSMFKDAKLDELVNIYSKAPATERADVFKLLEPIYPTEQERLEKIRKGDEK